jgi:hypothetical protein
MSDGFMPELFKVSSHVVKCSECQEKMKTANIIIKSVIDHMNNPEGQ